MILKDYIALLLTPTPMISVLLITALIFTFRGNLKWCKRLLTSATILFIVFANTLVPDVLLNIYEGSQPTLTKKLDKKVDYIVVLAGGVYNNDNHPLSSRLSTATMTRLLEGIFLLNDYPEAKLIVTGRGWTPGITEASLMAKTAIKLGVSENQIIQEHESKNTKDHPFYLKKYLKDKNFILVTSALHMPRAKLNFLKQNLKPIHESSTDHILKGTYQGWYKNFRLYPIGENLYASDRLIFELWGLLYTKIKY